MVKLLHMMIDSQISIMIRVGKFHPPKFLDEISLKNSVKFHWKTWKALKILYLMIIRSYMFIILDLVCLLSNILERGIFLNNEIVFYNEIILIFNLTIEMLEK
jgi:hypothetical protein